MSADGVATYQGVLLLHSSFVDGSSRGGWRVDDLLWSKIAASSSMVHGVEMSCGQSVRPVDMLLTVGLCGILFKGQYVQI